MPDVPVNPSESEGRTEDSDPASRDLSSGYQVMLYVHGDGSYAVGEPEPLTDEHEQSEMESVPDLATALKHVIAVVKQHPIGPSEQEGFDAGFSGGARAPAPAGITPSY
jgi:hypothetical protein